MLMLVTKLWNDAFHQHTNLQLQHKAIAHELRATRNEWAHQQEFSAEDTYRALDNIERLLKAIGAFQDAATIAEERKGLVLLMAQEIMYERKNGLNQVQPQTNMNQVYTGTTPQISQHYQPPVHYRPDKMDE